jgi:hypothetical protein
MSFARLAGRASAIATPLLLVALLLANLGGAATAAGGPADKFAATGSSIDQLDDATPILSEQMKVSSPADLVLQLTTECSIITELTTGGDAADSSSAFGEVVIWVTVDGKSVPVADDDANQDGKVVFCNRAYGRTVEDTEGDGDVDKEDDYIRTRTANAFNWIALNTGSTYDDPANGNNILDIVVWAEYTADTTGDAVADAFVGQRTLVVEPTHLANTETVGGSGS